MKKVLIVDDNDKYAIHLKNYFDKLGILTDRAVNAEEGWLLYLKNTDYDMIISDITMETQTSGLWLMRRIFKAGYSGILAIASTGFDVMGVMFISRYILTWFCGLHWMIPKIPLKAGEVIWFNTLRTDSKTIPF